jgi:hypothetical protein
VLEAALGYANLDWPILPCWWIEDGRCACGSAPGGCKPGKHPLGRLGPNGVKNASTDPAVIRSWWRRKPKANLAVRTGRQSGLTVVDIDGEEGERALVALERRFGALPDLYPMQWTGAGRGGWQAFVAWPEGREIRNSASRLEPKLDTRGEGGYVLVPPSAAAEPYRWAPDRDPWTLQPEPAPGWLLDLLDPPSAPEPRQPWSGQPRTAGADGDRYLERAIAAELALIASAPEGRRNDQFNESAFSLFRFAAEGRIAAGSVARGLEAAARHAGLAPREIASTLKSAATKRGVQL